MFEDLERLSKALKTCLNIGREEIVLVLCDDRSEEVARIIEDACRNICEEVLFMRMKPRAHNSEEPPSPVARAMILSDVVLAPTTKSISHTKARKLACKHGTRVASMPGFTKEMLPTLYVDYWRVKKISEKLAEMLTKAKKVRIVTDKETDVVLNVEGRRGLADTGILRKFGDFGNLPAGEAYIAPLEGKSYGKIVFDGSFAEVGLLKNELEIFVENGKAVKIKGYGEEILKNKLVGYGSYVAEFGIGTNPNAKVMGKVLVDEKVLGTVHIAFGTNFTFGGRIHANIHLDGVIMNPTVYIDDELVMENGRFKIEIY